MADNMKNKDSLTTNAGAPVPNNNHALTAGPRGPMLMQDVWFQEKLAHFDREVIPERRMHARGSGAYGTFTVTHDLTKYTRASLFAEIGKKTDVFARFSTVAGERGAADAERDIRGFALKFYTDQGNWDMVGNNTPVFFLRDPLNFPDLNHVVKRNPRTNMHSAKDNWDFWTLLPEALHQVTVVMSDRGIPASYRHMHGFGSHTYSLINAKNDSGSNFTSEPSRASKISRTPRPRNLSGATATAISAICTSTSKRATIPAGPCTSRSCPRKTPRSCPTIPLI